MQIKDSIFKAHKPKSKQIDFVDTQFKVSLKPNDVFVKTSSYFDTS